MLAECLVPGFESMLRQGSSREAIGLVAPEQSDFGGDSDMLLPPVGSVLEVWEIVLGCPYGRASVVTPLMSGVVTRFAEYDAVVSAAGPTLLYVDNVMGARRLSELMTEPTGAAQHVNRRATAAASMALTSQGLLLCS